MDKFGDIIRKKREEKGMLLRQLAAMIDVDTAILSKVERGERKAKREQVIKLANLLDTDTDELLTMWLADRVYGIVKDEETAEGALKVAENILKYSKNLKNV
ncbi:helix-turn-helix domain-containing protein [Sunxiuqinia dokdonensis]|uniref:HTH cro/C1-type domain-containing protein n=1 Tax=Sunxiuqinia dokdonensis TaxID=1409788 RepID=A0A0L8V354_9BACT|nr:helix-turn-helix transcriptional regulator [Sunxiuqinia dokdonensis]KOH42793.1 hypothetical protein NC99_44070 [Sunxiuqinia dokdonensis]